MNPDQECAMLNQVCCFTDADQGLLSYFQWTPGCAWCQGLTRMMLLKTSSLILPCCLVLMLSACSSPQDFLDRQADAFGFSSEVVVAAGFEHLVYRNRHPLSTEHAILHVYLEGDGRPWLRPGVIATDPTTQSPLMLELMAQDTLPSLYLGRPCYHGYSSSAPCHPKLWTVDRYSETVVASMTDALAKIIAGEKIAGVVIFGYSGGGSLAVLLADRIRQTVAVVTVAGNLDIDGWAESHQYTPLSGSLNPAKMVVLNAGIHQLHLVGGQDENVDEGVVRAFASRQTNAQWVVLAEYTHGCCWAQIWPQVLTWVAGIGPEDRGASRPFKDSPAIPR